MMSNNNMKHIGTDWGRLTCSNSVLDTPSEVLSPALGTEHVSAHQAMHPGLRRRQEADGTLVQLQDRATSQQVTVGMGY